VVQEELGLGKTSLICKAPQVPKRLSGWKPVTRSEQ
jgi:hypothetical protein